MSAVRCPKCGSDQIVNNECLKCRVILTKVSPLPQEDSTETSSSFSSISFVALTTSTRTQFGYARRAPIEIQSIPVSVQKKRSLPASLGAAVALIILAAGAISAYRYFVRQASFYSGYYWNNVHRFSLIFPEKGWSHYQQRDLRSLEFKDAVDAFYRGGSPEDPKVAMVVWAETTREPVPDTFDEDTSRRILELLQSEVQQRMIRANLQYEITGGSTTRIGGNDGFVILADLQKGSVRMKTMIYCAFAENSTYTIQFLGKDAEMEEARDEIVRLMSTFSFTKTMFG